MFGFTAFPQSRRLCPFLSTAIALILLLSGCASPPAARTWTDEYRSFAVAADHAIASEAGAEILALGGNAVDAAVATSFTLSVVRPFSCGIGGGGFMIIDLPAANGRSAVRTAINYREEAPSLMGANFYSSDPARSSTRGATAVGVPGTVAGLMHAHTLYGKLDRRTVMGPAIRAAERGFLVDRAYLNAARSALRSFERNPELKERFQFMWARYLRGGRVKLNDRISNPEQASALRLIARDGAHAFYQGSIAEAIADTVESDGGPLQRDDLRSYAPRETAPLEFKLGERRVLTMPPPSSGGVAMAQIAGVYNRAIARFPASSRQPELHAHLYVEASKHAFADRAEFLADPAFIDVPVSTLTSDAYLDELASRIEPNRTRSTAEYGDREPPPDDSGTSHFSIVDADGGAVACTETINGSFGSWLAVDSFGFLLNNEMDDFTAISGVANLYGLVQSDANLPAPGKQPLSSMSPLIALDSAGRVELVSGASGGPRIISATVQSLLIPNPLGLEQGNARPRLHHQWLPDRLYYESGVPEVVLKSLGKRGHRLSPTPSIAVVQLIRRVETPSGSMWRAESDPRKGGEPAGR